MGHALPYSAAWNQTCGRGTSTLVTAVCPSDYRPPTGLRERSSVVVARASGMHSLRIEGPDRAGLGARITRAVADRGINLRGASAACIGRKAVFYLALDSEPNLKEALRVVRKVLGK